MGKTLIVKNSCGDLVKLRLKSDDKFPIASKQIPIKVKRSSPVEKIDDFIGHTSTVVKNETFDSLRKYINETYSEIFNIVVPYGLSKINVFVNNKADYKIYYNPAAEVINLVDSDNESDIYHKSAWTELKPYKNLYYLLYELISYELKPDYAHMNIALNGSPIFVIRSSKNHINFTNGGIVW